MIQPRLARLAAALLAIASLAGAAAAQTTTGRISGTAVDSSGGVLPGVSVTATNEATGLSRTATTDAQGAYVFVDLPLGTYAVRSELSGFKSSVRTGNVLNADGRITVDFKLEVGSVSESVEVTAAGETVNTTSGEVARVVDSEQVQNLALNGRNYMQLATLVPGSPVLDTNALDIMTGLGINTSVNGSRTNASLLTVDGGFNMDSGSNNSQISNVGIDFIEQVSLKTSNFSAEYGRNSGASINVVTKSGSNQLKGSGYEYARRDRLDANNFFNNAAGVAKPKLRYDDYGWSLGGPAVRSKLFFFGGEEWKKIRRQTTPTFRTLPTSAMQAGDFSAITATQLKDPLTGQNFPGNVIPANRITPDGRAVAAVYAAMAKAAASYRDLPISNNALFQNDNPFDFRQDLVRLDWQRSSAQRFTARLLFDNYDLVDPGGTFINSQLPTVPTERKRPGRNWQIGHSWTIGPSLVNEATANAAWNGQRVPPIGDTWQRDTYGFVFPQLYANGGRFENSIPNTTVTGFASFSGASGSLVSPTTDLAFSDTLSWLKGAHTVRAGGTIIRNRKDQNGRSIYAGSVSFATAGNSRTTGNAFADALLGNFRTYSEAQLDPIGFFRFWQDEAFASDTWRVSRALTVEYGLRVQYHQPTYTQANNMASFDPSLYDPAQAMTVLANGTLVPGSGNRFNGMVRPCGGVPDSELARVPNGRDPGVLAVPDTAPCGFYPSQTDVAPRLSLAWTPDAGRTSIRGGAGLFIDRPEGNLYFPLVNNAPYSLSSQYENGNLSAPGGGTAAALAPLASMDAIIPDLKLPRTWQYSATLQRELPWGIFAEIGYVGSTGKNLLRQPDINQPSFEALQANAALPSSQRLNTNALRPYKGYSNINMRLSDADSRYNALQTFLSKRRGQLKWTQSYTLGSSKDNASGNGDNPEAYLDKNYNWGPSSFDRRHILVETWTWDVPFLRHRNDALAAVLGNWQVSGIYRYQSGTPLTISGNTAIGTRRADYLGGDAYIPDAQRTNATGAIVWLDPAQFAAAPEARLGNSARGQFTGPAYQVFDLSFRKAIPLPRNNTSVKFQADLFNAFNRVNFGTPSTTVTSANFGQITSVGPPRNIQLGLRIEF